MPTLNGNGWSFVFVPAYESDPKTGNLTVAGLNHSLAFGQVASMFAAGMQPRIRATMAFQDSGNSADISSLQTIEPVALLGGMALKVRSVGTGSDTTYGSARYWMRDILANQPVGIYFISASRAVVRDLVDYLTGAGMQLDNPREYVVVSGTSDKFSAQTYDDGTSTDHGFPRVDVPTGAQCAVPPVNPPVVAAPPSGLNFYRSRTVYFVRHVEAHPSGNFENGNYVCQGQWRALGSVPVLDKLLRKKPDTILSSNTSGLIDCGGACSYIRPLLTVTPFAIAHDMPVVQARFNWTDATDLAFWLFDKSSPYPDGGADNQLTLVGWEHEHIVEAVKALFAKVYKDPNAAKQLPDWSFTDYDTVWVLATDDKGNLTFNNTCEGIPSAKLPNICPAFLR